MKIENRKIEKNKLIVIIILIIFMLACAVFYYLYRSSTTVSEINSNSDKGINQVDYKPASNDQKSAATDNSSKSNDQKAQPELDSSIPIRLASFNQSADKLQIRVLIDELIDDGVCNASIYSRGSSSPVYTSESVGIQNQASVTTCKGFDIINSLDKGEYTIIIDIKSDTRNGKLSKEFYV